jgi:uncharacterized protein
MRLGKGMFAARILLPILAFVSPALAVAEDATGPDPFDYEPNPAVWRLRDDDTIIYMFGTVHALPPQLKWRSAALYKIIEDVDELVLETVDDKEAPTEYLDDQMVEAMLAGIDRKPLVDRVEPINRAILEQVVAELDVPMDFLDLLPTWMVAFELFYSGADEEGVSQEHGVETVLETLFAKMEKPVSGIEDAKAVNAALNALSEQQQMVALNQMLADIRTAPAYSLLPDAGIDNHPFADDIAWSKGDLSSIRVGTDPESMGQDYYAALLVNRNAAWTEWLAQRLNRPGKILLAVGSAHLAGPDSVQVMLEKKGLVVERLH